MAGVADWRFVSQPRLTGAFSAAGATAETASAAAGGDAAAVAWAGGGAAIGSSFFLEPLGVERRELPSGGGALGATLGYSTQIELALTIVFIAIFMGCGCIHTVGGGKRFVAVDGEDNDVKVLHAKLAKLEAKLESRAKP